VWEEDRLRKEEERSEYIYKEIIIKRQKEIRAEGMEEIEKKKKFNIVCRFWKMLSSSSGLKCLEMEAACICLQVHTA
jgi:hypothetical protein